MAARPRTLTALLMLGTILCGLKARFVALGLPRFAVKYGGSTMWTLMIYWVVSALRPAWRVGTAGLASAAAATAIELLKLYHAPALDLFRHTLAGVVLLGQYFSPWDLVAYWLAIGVGAMVDRQLRMKASLSVTI
jgi:hypothetical protein